MRHGPQRFLGKTVAVPHFNRERDESNPGIKTLLPFLKNITEENDLENCQDLMVALDIYYWLHKAISIRLSRFGDDRRCHLALHLADFKRRFPASQKILCTVWFICIFLSQSERDL